MIDPVKITEKKHMLYFGWFVYIAAIVVGMNKYSPLLTVLMFILSFSIIFRWCVGYVLPHLSKGLIMIFNGAIFTSILLFLINDKSILDIPKNLTLAYSMLSLIFGTAFFGTGGGLISSEAMKHTPDKNEKALYQKNVDITVLEEKVITLTNVVVILTVAMVAGFAVLIYLVV